MIGQCLIRAQSGSSILVAEAATIPSNKQDLSPAVAGQSSGSVQPLDAEQKLAATTASRWFSHTIEPPDSGEIDCHHTLLVLLHRVYSGRLTGKLQVVFGRVEKALFFDGGQLVFATSNDRQDGLGEVMLRSGALTQSQFEEASTLVETGQRFGSAIAEMGIYRVEEILSWVRRQVIQVISSVLDYPVGRYFFFGSLEKNVVPEIGAPVPLGTLLLQAVRKAEDLPLDRLARDSELRAELTPEPLRLFTTEDLDDRERYLLGLISQGISAKDVIYQSGLTRPQVSRALYALLLLGFVAEVPKPVKPDAVKPERDPGVPVAPVADKELSSVKVEESKAVETPSAAEIPQQPSAQDAGSAEQTKVVDASAVASNAQRQSAAVRDDATQVQAPLQPQAHEVKVVDIPGVANIPEQRTADLPAKPEDAKAIETPPAEKATHAQPQLEEIPPDPEEPKETEAAPATSLPLLKPNMISREVPVRATGIPQKNGLERQLFNEETASVLIAETGGVIRLAAAVAPGQLLVLANIETKREVIVQVLRKRVYKPTICYLELEFLEVAPRFWGTEFSAATALLPKNAKDAETAALVITARATEDQPWVLPTAPDAGELQIFKREMEDLRGKLVLTDAPDAAAQAGVLGQPSAEGSEGSPSPGPADPLSTVEILKSGLAAAGTAPPIERDTPPAPWESGERAQTPQTVNDFINSLPKKKRWRLPRGSFTPGFRTGVLRLAFLAAALVVTLIGAAWFKNLLPWKRAEAKLGKTDGYNMRVASDIPVTSAGTPANSAPVSNPAAAAGPGGTAAPVGVPSSSAPVEPPALKKNASGKATAGKPSVVRPVTKTADSNAASEKENVFVPPKLIHAEQAVASLEAMHDFERGNVVVDAVVGTSGEVHVISVLSGPPSLRDPAVESLKQYQYEPATRNGQPVPAHVTITIHFRFEP